MNLSRRHALGLLGALGAGAALGPLARVRPVQAQAAGKKLVLVLASGGWDPTYVFDAKPGSTVIDQSAGTLATPASIPILTSPERPSVTAFFERYGAATTVVNGLQVRSFVHSDCIKRLLSGTPSETSPDLGAIVGSVLGSELPMPYLVLGTSARSGPLASLTVRAGTTNQMASLLGSRPGTVDLFLPASGYAPDDVERNHVDRYLETMTARVRSRLPQRSVQHELDAFQRSLERRELLRQFAQTRGGFGERKYTPDLEVQVEVALSALESGLCQSTLLETGDWDTHDNNARQSEKFEALFKSLIPLVSGLETRGLLDDTVVLVFSEMGRTPKLNPGLGKDHWPVTSCFVLGGGIRGGRVIGATDGALSAESVDFATGTPSASGKQIQTSNFIAGILERVGVDPAPHLPGSEPLHALGA